MNERMTWYSLSSDTLPNIPLPKKLKRFQVNDGGNITKNYMLQADTCLAILIAHGFVPLYLSHQM